MKKHLRILYGADRRYQMVNDTVKSCHKYFETVRLLNTGPKEFESEFQNFPSNTSIETSAIFFGDLEMTRWNFLHDVDLNDWVVFLDADERPSEIFLHNLDNVIKDCEDKGYLKCRFPWVQHEAEDQGSILHYLDRVKNHYPSNREEWNGPKGSGVYAKDILVKNAPDIHPVTSFGGHGGYCLTAEYTVDRDNYFPYFVNHHKSRISKHQSIVLSTWFLPFINIGTQFHKTFWKECKCFHLLLDFRKRNDVVLQNDLVRKLSIEKDVEFKSRLKELLLREEFKTADGPVSWYRDYYIWANDFDCGLETPNSYCGLHCCNYDGVQY